LENAVRIQILRLPDEFVGDQVKDRFALVIDQWPEGDSTRWDAALKGFATDCGRRPSSRCRSPWKSSTSSPTSPPPWRAERWHCETP
jgi:hypothetical protein